MPHILSFLNESYQTIFEVLETDNEVAPLLGPFQTAFKNKAMEQLEGMIERCVSIPPDWLPRNRTGYSTRDGDDFDLKVSDPKNPSYLLIANDPEMESIIGALNALILKPPCNPCEHRTRQEHPREHHRGRASDPVLPQDRPPDRNGPEATKVSVALGFSGTAAAGSRLRQGGHGENHHHRRQRGERFCPKQGDPGMAEQRHLRQGGTDKEGRNHRPRQDLHQSQREHGQPGARLENLRHGDRVDLRPDGEGLHQDQGPVQAAR